MARLAFPSENPLPPLPFSRTAVLHLLPLKLWSLHSLEGNPSVLAGSTCCSTEGEVIPTVPIRGSG